MHRIQGEAASNFETITPGVVREKLLFCFLFLILFVLSFKKSMFPPEGEKGNSGSISWKV